MRWCVYVDMDAFYVSCELRERPELRGKPAVVGPEPKDGPSRGVVLSASYEARKFGLRSAMPVARARALLPSAVWIPPDFEKYERNAREVRSILSRFSGAVIPFSIDEAALYIDAPSTEGARRVAEEIQRTISSELLLPSSLGVATYRAVAKIATDQAKPGGIRVVAPDQVVEFLVDLPVRAIPGVGPKTEAILDSLQIRRIGDLRSGNLRVLRARLGVFADELVALANGAPRETDADSDSGPRSRSSEVTFAEDTRHRDQILGTVRELAEQTADSVAREGLQYRTVTVRVRWEDFAQIQRSHSLPAARAGPESLVSDAVRLTQGILGTERSGRDRKVRLVSVQASQLSSGAKQQRRLDRFESIAEPNS